MKSSPLLSILIPTFKNERYLEICLHSLTNLIADFDCEVLVIDNDFGSGNVKNLLNSTDVSFKSKIFHISGNLLECTAESSIRLGLEFASGEYVWIIGNDDFIVADSRSFLLAIKEWPDFLFVGSNKDKLINIYNIQKFLPNYFFKRFVIVWLNLAMGHTPRFIFRKKLIEEQNFDKKFGQLSFLNLCLNTFLRCDSIKVWCYVNIELDNAPSDMKDIDFFRVFVKDLASVCRNSIWLFYGIFFFNRVSRFASGKPGNWIEAVILANYWVKNRMKNLIQSFH